MGNKRAHRRALRLVALTGLAALNTFGKASRFNSTWVHTDGVSWSTIDYVCVRLQGGYGRASRPLIDLPVSLGGYRDHRPVEATIYAGLRCKLQRPPSELRWNRDLIMTDLKDLQRAQQQESSTIPERVSQLCGTVDRHLRERRLRGEWQHVCGPGQAYGTTSEYFDALEGAIVDAAVDIYTTPPTKQAAPAFPDETWELIAKKQLYQRMLAKAVLGSWLHKTLTSQYKHFMRLAKKAVRAFRRQRTAELVDQAEQADHHNDIRKGYAIIRRIAPKPTAPSMTVHNPATGTVCFDHEEDMEVRARALCTIFQAEDVTESAPRRPPRHGMSVLDDPSEAITVENTIEAVRKLPNHKAAPVLKWSDPGSALSPMPRPQSDGAVAEIWKLCLDYVAEPLTQVFQACHQLKQVAQRFKDGETVSLRKPKGDGRNAQDHYRTINLINHMGKAFINVACMGDLRKCAGRLSTTQFGALPQRSTRDAVVIVDEIIRRFRVCRSRTNLPALILVAALVDL
ncbi:unnamed protein product, partial [Prorocentrum cordatum]